MSPRPVAGLQAAASSGGAARRRETRLLGSGLGVRGTPPFALTAAVAGDSERPGPYPPALARSNRSPPGSGGVEVRTKARGGKAAA
ncbi:hypothetical protein NDU88_003571 [Pleurodeles waltl]|uniref:Uncharacterized protein n=1 Tax=Pleurodeles waltl TaxID=8319 RepID=A0AAV7QFV3_PLEWA|nr:hypothetical protein NDU88_003571 [Pleurodeles waltl]